MLEEARGREGSCSQDCAIRERSRTVSGLERLKQRRDALGPALTEGDKTQVTGLVVEAAAIDRGRGDRNEEVRAPLGAKAQRHRASMLRVGVPERRLGI